MAVTEGEPAKDIATGTVLRAHILSHKHKEEKVGCGEDINLKVWHQLCTSSI